MQLFGRTWCRHQTQWRGTLENSWDFLKTSVHAILVGTTLNNRASIAVMDQHDACISITTMGASIQWMGTGTGPGLCKVLFANTVSTSSIFRIDIDLAISSAWISGKIWEKGFGFTDHYSMPPTIKGIACQQIFSSILFDCRE
jgi:hypothetical protein